MDSLVSQCRICRATLSAPLHVAREMTLGAGKTFTYAQCGSCQCLQLSPVLDDFTQYYGADYYSFQSPHAGAFGLSANRFRSALVFYFGGYGLVQDSRILDVGCGSGSLLQALAGSGFRNCLGIDPYVSGDTVLCSGAKVQRSVLADMEPEWDFILFNHSFEHIKDPLAALLEVSRLLTGMGVCIIRMPVVPCYAWDHYGTDWVQLDAPRHAFVHSSKSLGILAMQTGLVVIETRYDSTAFQFWGSELYRLGLALSNRAGFSRAQMDEFERKARQLNLARNGDQAVFYLRRSSKSDRVLP